MSRPADVETRKGRCRFCGCEFNGHLAGYGFAFLGRHERRCEIATEQERQHYREKRRWPERIRGQTQYETDLERCGWCGLTRRRREMREKVWPDGARGYVCLDCPELGTDPLDVRKRPEPPDMPDPPKLVRAPAD